jgi:hypothetical protein
VQRKVVDVAVAVGATQEALVLEQLGLQDKVMTEEPLHNLVMVAVVAQVNLVETVKVQMAQLQDNLVEQELQTLFLVPQ